jgi:hypothetical protein
MTPQSHRGIRPSFVSPRKPALDPDMRRQIYGHVRPMDCDMTWWERLFRR